MRRVSAGRSSILMVVAAVAILGYACESGSALSADQQRGKRIYESLCDKCHKLIPPKTHSDEQWNQAADRYGTKLKLQSNEVALLKVYLTRANDADFK